MSGRIERRSYRVGTADTADPERIEELEARRAKHERVTSGKRERTFAEILDERRKRDAPEEEAAPVPEKGAIDPLLGLDPNQDPAIANAVGKHRSARVIIKG